MFADNDKEGSLLRLIVNSSFDRTGKKGEMFFISHVFRRGNSLKTKQDWQKQYIIDDNCYSKNIG